jgi:hypothetical protein
MVADPQGGGRPDELNGVDGAVFRPCGRANGLAAMNVMRRGEERRQRPPAPTSIELIRQENGPVASNTNITKAFITRNLNRRNRNNSGHGDRKATLDCAGME